MGSLSTILPGHNVTIEPAKVRRQNCSVGSSFQEFMYTEILQPTSPLKIDVEL
jgi:hypothetical protein